jgi:hypothetical protein
MTTFLSQENARYISETFNKFMNDKYAFSYTSVISDSDYYKLLGDTMTTVYSTHNTTKEKGSLNLITISELKKYFFEKYISINTDPENDLSLNTGASTILEPIVEEDPVSDEALFLNKLQKLELNRKTFAITPTPDKDISPLLPTMNDQIYNASPYAPATITTVYMPAPVKIGKEIKIYSSARNWMIDRERNYFAWKGPLPKLLDRTNTRVGCLICPTTILADANMLSLVIEGANEDEVSVSVIPSHSVGSYTIFRPILESLSYLKLLALPWRISLETCDSEKLDLGRDGNNYTVVGECEEGTCTTLSIKDAHIFAAPGDSLRIYIEKTKKIIPSKVLRLRENEHEVDVTGTIRHDGQLLNFSRQITIVFEMTITEHKN